jgi:hypothetical protein
LRARDEMARRRSICPRCGQPVGIPARESTYPGTAAVPLTPTERVRLAGQRGTAAPPASSAPASRDQVGVLMLALLTGRRAERRKAERTLETRWYDYLVYPFHDWQVWMGPALLLAWLTVAVLLLAPRLFAEPPESPTARWALGLTCVLVLFFLSGYPCNFLGCVLRSASRGDGSAARWKGHTFAAITGASALWLVCFLAGPLVFAVVAALYWMQCGDPDAADWIILAELCVLTVGYQMLALAAFGERGKLRDLNPLHVIDLAHRLRWRAAAAAAAGSALAASHGLLAMVAAENVHRTALGGALLMAACWFSGLFWATLLFRLLGVWCYRARPLAA